MAATVSSEPLPPHELENTSTTTSISVNSWKITASSQPISNASQLDELQAEVGFTLPEMLFGGNSVVLSHAPSGLTLTFDARGALKCVCNHELGPGDGGVKVGYAEDWMKTRAGPDAANPLPDLVATKPYDWTYTTTYAGHTSSALPKYGPADPEDVSQSIPMDRLTRPDPIMYYAGVPLFEDELHDNGSSTYTIRVRVMPSCFFLLARFSLRVDNVLFRQYDTRLFHEFSSSFLIRETAGWEAPYATIRARLPHPEDLTPLTDPQFVATAFAELPARIAQNKRAVGGTGWRGLGRAVEVMHLKSCEDPSSLNVAHAADVA